MATEAAQPSAASAGGGTALRSRNRLFAALLLADACVIALHIANDLSGFEKRLFDLEQEQNLPTWLSSIQLAGVALLAGVYSAATSGRIRVAGGIFAAVFAFLSLDEFALLHEELVEQVTNSSSADPWFWPVLYSPLAVILMLAAFVFAAESRRVLGSAVALLASLAMLVTSVLIDSAATQLRDTPSLFFPVVMLEEVLELVGGALLIFVLYRMIRARSMVLTVGGATPSSGSESGGPAPRV